MACETAMMSYAALAAQLAHYNVINTTTRNELEAHDVPAYAALPGCESSGP
jgi:hypothetical protein